MDQWKWFLFVLLPVCFAIYEVWGRFALEVRFQFDHLIRDIINPESKPTICIRDAAPTVRDFKQLFPNILIRWRFFWLCFRAYYTSNPIIFEEGEIFCEIYKALTNHFVTYCKEEGTRVEAWRLFVTFETAFRTRPKVRCVRVVAMPEEELGRFVDDGVAATVQVEHPSLEDRKLLWECAAKNPQTGGLFQLRIVSTKICSG